jgi:hypothetical protein
VTEAPVPNLATEDEILDFTVERKPIRFRVDDDIFEAVSALPTMVAFELTGVGDAMREARTADERRDAFLAVFSKILKPQSLDRFIARLGDPDHPIDAAQLIAIVQGLLGRYGLRPTQPSGESSPPLPVPGTGTPSTDEFPWPGWMPDASHSTGS